MADHDKLIEQINAASPETLHRVILAVVELHVPMTPPNGHSWVSGGRAPLCAGCDTGDPFVTETYPCSNIKVILAAIKNG